MKIVYFSCHSILEYDEVTLFHQLGYDIFSAGAYSNPFGHESLSRPGIAGLRHYPDLEKAASTLVSSEYIIPDELIEWGETLIFMHNFDGLVKNWTRIKHKRVIYRCIGQLMPHQELKLAELRLEGLQIVRYSPQESKIEHFAGEDALIRFYKDSEEYGGYWGEEKEVINITQSLADRDRFVFREEIEAIMRDFPHKIYGIRNEMLPDFGGKLTDTEMKGVLRRSRAYVYGGTYPAAYTLAFIEAMMTGMPIIALGWGFTANRFENLPYSEIPELIVDGVEGFVVNDIQRGRDIVNVLLEDQEKAQIVSYNARARAIELFGKEKIALQWQKFLG